MTDSPEKTPGKDPEPQKDIFQIGREQAEKIGILLDYSQTITKVSRQQADNWHNVARAFYECGQMAEEIATDCALIARISADRAGDIIATEWGIEETEAEEEVEEDD